MEKVNYEGHSFDKSWLLSFKSEKDFLDAMNKVEKDGSGYKHYFEGDANRTAKLTEMYRIASTDGKKNTTTQAATLGAVAGEPKVS